MNFQANQNQALNDEQLQRIAPAIFAEAKHEDCSDKYSFIPTITVVNQLRNEGWMPVWAAECNVRDLSKKGFQKHMMRFRKFGDEAKNLTVGDSVIETVLVNSQ